MSADGLVVVGPEQPTERRVQAEDREEAAGDQHAVRRLGLPVVGEIGAEHPVRGDAGEAGLRRSRSRNIG